MTLTFRLKTAECTARLLYGTPVVCCTTVTGARFQLQAAFADLQTAQRTAEKVLARGSIDASLWSPLTPEASSRAAAHLQANAKAIDLYAQRHRVAA